MFPQLKTTNGKGDIMSKEINPLTTKIQELTNGKFWVIWDMEWGFWLRDGGSGHTDQLKTAGRFTLGEAYQIVATEQSMPLLKIEPAPELIKAINEAKAQAKGTR